MKFTCRIRYTILNTTHIDQSEDNRASRYPISIHARCQLHLTLGDKKCSLNINIHLEIVVAVYHASITLVKNYIIRRSITIYLAIGGST